MTKDRWLEIIDLVQERSPTATRRSEPLTDGPGSVDILEFENVGGKFRLEFTSEPRITGKKAMGGRKVGAGASVTYEYSPDEEVHDFSAWRWDGSAWKPFDAEALL